ncbi:MvaI/BcnI family restriction endonuclease [Neptuniibacter sp. QD37_6]|uniref:MvaI/BcnI family restriction endonuclease n=1 Tax=Neptuniibacter sp. QD37_6 TaxID=3398210 RepID=UPI0039F4ED5E
MNWSEKELKAAIDSYFELLKQQKDGLAVNKSEIYRNLGRKFSRSPKSFEWKFQNISAVLYEQHLPYCDGLKPAYNYQRLLKLMVLDRLERSPIPSIQPHHILFSKLKALRKIEVKAKGAGRFGLAIERALGIKANSSKEADFMGVELKTKHGNSLQTLFSRVPQQYFDSNGKTGFFNKHCSYDEQKSRRSLYTSFNNRTDTLGFSLHRDGFLIEVLRNGERVMAYGAEQIEEALLSKHSQTAFISISASKGEKKEYCFIDSIKYCKWPSILRFLQLIDEGKVFLDLTMSEKNGKIRDHGFLWRIKSDSLEQLYLKTENILMRDAQ